MTAEEALRVANEDGLELIAAPCTKTGYKGVSRGGRSAKKPYQAVRGSFSLGYYCTAEEAALAYARFVTEEQRTEGAGGVVDLKTKRERKQSGKITRWVEAEEAQLRALVSELGATGYWSQVPPP